MNSATPLRFAIVTPDSFAKWHTICLAQLLADNKAEPVMSFSLGQEFTPHVSQIPSGILDAIEAAFPRVDVPPELMGIPSLNLSDATKALGEIPPLDFILDLTGTHLPKAIRSIPRYGVWSFLLGEESGPCTPCPCLTETIGKHDLLHGALYRQGETATQGTILKRFTIRNQYSSLKLNVRAMSLAGVEMPGIVCADIHNDQHEHTSAPPQTFSQQESVGLKASLQVALRQWYGYASKVWAKLFDEEWNIGLYNRPIATHLLDQADEPKWLFPSSRKHFRADPFGVELEDGIHLFYEKFDMKSRFGFLAQATVIGGQTTELDDSPHTAKHHQSYPYLIHHGDVLLALPESSQSGTLELHQVDLSTGAFHSPVTILHEQVSDATMIEFENIWWLFAVKKGFKLYAWYADCPTGPWKAHPLNPLKTDPRSARPGGTPFIHEGTLYRPAQDCSQTYGGAISLCRVDELTTTSFRETVVKVMAPLPDSKYPDGMHTLSQVGDKTLVDGKRMIFAPGLFLRTLFKKLHQG